MAYDEPSSPNLKHKLSEKGIDESLGSVAIGKTAVEN